MKPGKSFDVIEKFACLTKDSVVFDLGGWDGQFAQFFAERAGTVITVEPMIKDFREILLRIVENNLTNIIPVRAAIAYYSGVSDIYVSKRSGAHSLIRKDRFDSDNERALVPITSWDDLVDSLLIDKVDFAKVNIEGAEYMLLKGMTKVFPRRMVIEEHSKDGVTDLDHLKKLIKIKGYDIVKINGDDLYLEYVNS